MTYNIIHEKAFTAQNLVYIGYVSLTLMTGLGVFAKPLFGEGMNVDVQDLKVAWVGATTSLITWLVAKVKLNGETIRGKRESQNEP